MLADVLKKTLAIAVLTFAASGCAASAHFYSKTGVTYARETKQAVLLDDNEVGAVQAAGGFPIGTVEGAGLTTMATQNDVAYKASVVAAKNGGTHLLQTDAGVNTFTYDNPAQREKECTWDRSTHTRDCTTTWTPPSQTVVEKQTGRYVVFLVPVENWGKLPPNIRPGGGN